MKWIVVIASALGYGYLSFLHQRSDFSSFLAVWLLLAATFFYFYREKKRFTAKEILILGIGFRLIFIGHTPELSNDYFRFLWDGMVVNWGENPYLQSPINYPYFYLPEGAGGVSQGAVYINGMNSAQYYSPYPPVCQFIWGFSEGTFTSLTAKLITLRGVVLLFEIGTLLLLMKILRMLKKDALVISLYALNPLIILEFSASLHPEVFMLFFLLCALYLYLKNRQHLSALSFGLAVASKFLPLIILPFLIFKIGFRKTMLYGIIVLCTVVAVFLPFYNPIIPDNIRESVELYFGQFYFNASFFYVLKELAEWMYGRDLRFDIAPILSLVSATSILVLAFYRKNSDSFFNRILLAFSIYFLLATTVHPWYIGILVLAGIFTKYTFPFAWSLLVMLSYSHYTGGEMREHYAWIILEYAILLGWMVVDFKRYIPFNVGRSAGH